MRRQLSAMCHRGRVAPMLFGKEFILRTKKEGGLVPPFFIPARDTFPPPSFSYLPAISFFTSAIRSVLRPRPFPFSCFRPTFVVFFLFYFHISLSLLRCFLLSYFCLTKRPNVGGAQKSQAQPHFLSFQPKGREAGSHKRRYALPLCA